jgi:hypothetical protein
LGPSGPKYIVDRYGIVRTRADDGIEIQSQFLCMSARRRRDAAASDIRYG